MADTLRRDNGTLPARATCCSPTQLPGPFHTGVYTAFTPTGGSLKTVSACTFPDQHFSVYSIAQHRSEILSLCQAVWQTSVYNTAQYSLLKGKMMRLRTLLPIFAIMMILFSMA